MTDSEASVTGGSFTAQTKLYGGRAETETEKRSETSALRNKRTFTTGDTVTELYGGYAYARPTKTSISLQANENHLTLKAGANDYVAGGYARGTQMQSSTRASCQISPAPRSASTMPLAAQHATRRQRTPSPSRQMARRQEASRVR